MSTFANAIKNQETTTTNGMKARVSTSSALVDFFYAVGASRGKNIIPAFSAANSENMNLAGRIALWARDIRGGAGERQVFRDILKHLATNNPDQARALMHKIPEIGRWDDLFVFVGTDLEKDAFSMYAEALEARNGLAAKWADRKGPIAAKFREFLGWTPKFYRKRLVELTKVVENQMCAKEWDKINFNHVPSVASSRYKKAFYKHVPNLYQKWASDAVKGENGAKVNASAVYPYDVIKGVGSYGFSSSNLDHIRAQWNALPNYVGDSSVLALVDVSGSMICRAGGVTSKSDTTCLDVAVSLGLYFADKNKGKFKDCFLTFSSSPELLYLKGDIISKINQMIKSTWQMSTNLHTAFEKILSVAIKNSVPADEMPETLLILSDMQFNSCVTHGDSAIEMITRKYENAGYKVPKVVFWNLNSSYKNVPVEHTKSGVALVSGFSPAIAKSILSSNLDEFSPENIMMQTIMNPRYDY